MAEALCVYWGHTGPLKRKELFDKAFSQAAKDRQKKVMAYLFEKDRCLSLGAELLLKKALAERNIPVDDLEYGYTQHHKPYLLKHPGLFFNLSHSGDYAMAVAADSKVGCDLEAMAPLEEDLPAWSLSEEEFKVFKAAPPQDQKEIFYRLWTLKEAYVKAAGMGLALSFKDLSFYLEPYGKARLVKPDRGDLYHFYESSVIPGYKSSVCVEGEMREVVWKEVDLTELLEE